MSTFDSKYKLANDPWRLTAKQKPDLQTEGSFY